jgi:hypothetical protein
MVARIGEDSVDSYHSIMKIWRWSWLGGIGLLVAFVIGQASHIAALWVVAVSAFFCLTVTLMTVATLRTRSLVNGVLHELHAPKEAAHRLTLRVLKDPVAFDQWRSEFAGKGDS